MKIKVTKQQALVIRQALIDSLSYDDFEMLSDRRKVEKTLEIVEEALGL